MYARLWVHVVWTTRDRAPLLNQQRAEFLAQHLDVVARRERATLLALGVVTTHVHLLLKLHPTTHLPRLLQRMKGATACRINREVGGAEPLRWAKGYSATSVGPRQLDAAAGYVLGQHRRHPDQAIVGWPEAESGGDQ